VNNGAKETETQYYSNDRSLHEWLKFSGRWDSKTISAKRASIPQFEIFCQGKPFERHYQSKIG
jgi:hypothetical protein